MFVQWKRVNCPNSDLDFIFIVVVLAAFSLKFGYSINKYVYVCATGIKQSCKEETEIYDRRELSFVWRIFHFILLVL